MFKKLKEYKNKAEAIEEKFEKYRIKKTEEKEDTIKITYTLEPFSRYKLRVYGENSTGKASTTHLTQGPGYSVNSDVIYTQGEFTIWKNDEKLDKFKFNKSTTSSEFGPKLVRGMKVYDFHPEKETEITIEGKKYKGKLLCAELFKDIPQDVELEAKQSMDEIGDYMAQFSKKIKKIILPIMVIVFIVIIISILLVPLLYV